MVARYSSNPRTSLRLGKQLVSTLEDPAVNGRWFTYIEGVDDPTQVLVEHTSISFHKTQPSARYTGGSFRHYPGPHDIDGLQMVFYETWDFRVTEWLNNWRFKVFNAETGIYGTPKDYRREIMTEFYPPSSESPVYRRSYSGCFPVEQQPFEMTYAESEGRLTVACLFAVNRTTTAFYTGVPTDTPADADPRTG